ncbi:NAD(P)-dependent oxidoreductase [Lewinella sp. W8]|uniref:NAD(P)-dependent oxidoreductase n=1 Tax=Lewinella sp. W8 TaxID=2528208 RepID=UPI0010676050|nr:NAD(P)-dependent oxidoreductase [Lewinella sp. W8]MTB50586.1 NAD-binding protein [Lewinella sp. W8]
MKIAFIGLGIMGSRMAANLTKSDAEVVVWNRTLSAATPLKSRGATVAASLAEAVGEADLVFSMLSTPEVVAECFFGADGALSKMHSGSLWVDCTTVNPGFSRKAAAEAKAFGVQFFDAPVAGSKPQAEGAQLAFFVGATEEAIVPMRPYLDTMGAKVIPFGEVGKGASFKMLVNIMLAQSMIIFSEAVLLGERLGLAREFLLDVLPGLVVSAPFTKFKAEMIRQENYEVQFPLEWMLKDLHLASVTAYGAKQPVFMANLAKEMFAAADKEGLGRLDFSAIHQYLARREG